MPNYLADTSFLIDIINDRNGRREFLGELPCRRESAPPHTVVVLT